MRNGQPAAVPSEEGSKKSKNLCNVAVRQLLDQAGGRHESAHLLFEHIREEGCPMRERGALVATVSPHAPHETSGRFFGPMRAGVLPVPRREILDLPIALVHEAQS